MQRSAPSRSRELRRRPHLASSGQPATRVLSPSTCTRRAGRWRASSQAGASSSRNDTVLATFASTHVFAATVTVRHGDSAGRPVRGSTRWWSSVAPLRQRRTVVDDVASPPHLIATVRPGASGGAAWSSTIRTGHPSAGVVPATAMSPPIPTRAPPATAAAAVAARSHARALAVAPRSSSTPAGTRTVAATSSSSTVCQPGTVQNSARNVVPSRAATTRNVES